MTETTNMEAMTIHRLFGIGKANRGEKVSGDLFVIDEASMLDAEMASWLFSSIPDGSQVILIGDIDQLPSVGPGNILKDLITSQVIPVMPWWQMALLAALILSAVLSAVGLTMCIVQMIRDKRSCAQT